MAEWAIKESNIIDYTPRGETLGGFSEKTIATFAQVFTYLNILRRHGAAAGLDDTDAEPFDIRIDTSTGMIYGRNADNTGWLRLGCWDEFWGITPEDIKAVRNGGGTGSRGWNYTFDTEFTRRLIMRSQGTVLSAHQLHKAKVPGKYFGIARCFRYDKVDATHLSDFYQTEGIVLGEDVNLRTLLGILRMFAVEIAGATEVKYVPGYFPFTEPSIEVHIKHPKLGWFELGGSGIFRPEVTEAMGVHVPVLAWGIGIDRMALMALGLNDLRELFSEDVEKVRLRKAKF
mgnify:CR=1 FL=1